MRATAKWPNQEHKILMELLIILKNIVETHTNEQIDKLLVFLISRERPEEAVAVEEQQPWPPYSAQASANHLAPEGFSPLLHLPFQFPVRVIPLSKLPAHCRTSRFPGILFCTLYTFLQLETTAVVVLMLGSGRIGLFRL